MSVVAVKVNEDRRRDRTCSIPLSSLDCCVVRSFKRRTNRTRNRERKTNNTRPIRLMIVKPHFFVSLFKLFLCVLIPVFISKLPHVNSGILPQAVSWYTPRLSDPNGDFGDLEKAFAVPLAEDHSHCKERRRTASCFGGLHTIEPCGKLVTC